MTSALTGSARARSLIFALLVGLSTSGTLEAVCSASQPPDRNLWIELISCSDSAMEEISGELFLQAVERTDADWTGHALPQTRKLLLETPGVLIVARELAFADSNTAFTKRSSTGKYEVAYSDRPGVWQVSEPRPERRYYLGSTHATCGELLEAHRLVAKEVFNCCDTGRGPGIACILQVKQIEPSGKNPPTLEELGSTELPTPGAPPAD